MPTSFGPFAFDRQNRLLWRDGIEVALPPRVLGVLEVLLDRPGQIVARQDLLDGVWKDAFVTDTSLAEAVSFLRQALGDDPQAPRYIQTVHRRGYRFLPVLTETPPRGLTLAAPDRGQTPVGGLPTRSGSDPGRPEPGSDPGEALCGGKWGQSCFCDRQAVPMVGITAMVCRDIDHGAGDLGGLAHRDQFGGPRGAAGRALRRPAGGRHGLRSPRAGARRLRGRPGPRLVGLRGGLGHLRALRAPRRSPGRRLASPGTDGGASPFFSPDGRWIGFFADGKLKKIAASGGAPSIVADAPAPGGAAWGPDGRIAFAGLPAGGLSLVSDQGGPVTALTTPQVERGEVRHLSPSWLPGGTAVLFTSASSPMPGAPGDLEVVAPGSTSPRVLRGGVTRAARGGTRHPCSSRAATICRPPPSTSGR